MLKIERKKKNDYYSNIWLDIFNNICDNTCYMHMPWMEKH